MTDCLCLCASVCVCVLDFHGMWVVILIAIRTFDAKHTLLIAVVVSQSSFQEDSKHGCSKYS